MRLVAADLGIMAKHLATHKGMISKCPVSDRVRTLDTIKKYYHVINE